jgi:hypothetical protein
MVISLCFENYVFVATISGYQEVVVRLKGTGITVKDV